MCKLFNEYFGTVFTDEDLYPLLPDVQDIFKDDQSKKLCDFHVTADMVLSKLIKLKLNKAPGVDELVPKVLIETAHHICRPLSVIFNASLNSGIVPKDWKQANVSVLFKKGSKNLPGNYRPISLTSHVCKVLESLIRDEITKHVMEFKLVKETQHGFVRNRSCLTNLLEYLHYVQEHVDKGTPVDVIYLDFQKAFDKVPHRRLVKKIIAHGIEGNVCH